MLGRAAVIPLACELPIDAAVDCYGAFVISSSPPELPFRMEPIIDRAPKISCPILGLFGVEDKNPAPDEVAQIDAELTRLGRNTSSTRSTMPATGSSRSIGPATASRPRSRAGG